MRKILIGLFFCLVSAFLLYYFSSIKIETENRTVAAAYPVVAEVHLAKTGEKPIIKLAEKLPGKRMPKKIVRQVRAAIESNNLCDLITVPVHDYDFCFSTLDPWMADAKSNSEVQELFSKNGPLFSLNTGKRQSLAARFLDALRMAGLFDVCGSAGYTKLNFKEAEKILMDLELEDSRNAAYPFFRLSLLKMRKASRDEILLALDAMTHGLFFDSHLAKMTNFIYETSLRNETFWFHGRSVGTRFPFPSYFGSVRALKELASVPNESEKVSFVAELMMREAMSSKKPYWELSYIPMEFALGRSLAVAADSRRKESLMEYDRIFSEGDKLGTDINFDTLPETCDQSSVRDRFENIKRITAVNLE